MKARSKLSTVYALTLVMMLPLIPATAAAQNRPCAEDARRLCQHIQPYNRRTVFQCLGEHKEELSPACRDRMEDIRHRVNALREACSQDVQDFCGNAQPGGGAIRACLKKHRDALSEPCREALAKARDMRRSR